MNKYIWLSLSIVLLALVLWMIPWDNKESVEAPILPSAVENLMGADDSSDLTAIRQRKQLRALVPYGRSDFAIMANGQVKGLQVEFLKKYEELLNKGIQREVDKTHIIWIPTAFDRLLPDLIAGKGDIAAAFLSITPERLKKVSFATGTQFKANELLVTHHSVTDIHQLEDLAGREIYVLKGSSYEEHLQQLNEAWLEKGLDPIVIKTADRRLLSEDLLKMVNAGMVPMTVVDDYKAHLWAKVLPNIRVLDDVQVKSDNQIGWAVRKNNPLLLESLSQFSESIKVGSLMGNMLFNRYFNEHWLKRSLAEDEESKVREVIDVFSKYAATYDYDVLAAVAQAYQESHLDHQRQSHRGAVGIMQLLPSTAASPNVGIPDISSMENNIHAGVKYLSFLRQRYFSDPDITDLDRLAFGWAAYNAGPAKVIKMRRLAEEMGLNPNIWFDHVELAAAKIVGRETVHYVRSIFTHYIAYSLVKERFGLKEEQLSETSL